MKALNFLLSIYILDTSDNDISNKINLEISGCYNRFDNCGDGRDRFKPMYEYFNEILKQFNPYKARPCTGKLLLAATSKFKHNLTYWVVCDNRVRLHSHEIES